MSRELFLKSKFNTIENKFNLKIPIQPNHRFIFDNVARNFQPSIKSNNEIKELVTRKDLNLCVDRCCMIYFRGNIAELNTLKFFLLMNFLSNWKQYNQYVVNLVLNDVRNNDSLSYKSTSLTELHELRFRDDEREKLNDLYNVDILFLTTSETYLYNNNFGIDVLKMVLSMRYNQGLITVVFNQDLNKNIKDGTYDDNFLEVPIKQFTYKAKNKTINNSHNIKKENKTFEDSEVF